LRIYDVAEALGVSIGIDDDTAAFAANAIRSWQQLMDALAFRVGIAPAS